MLLKLWKKCFRNDEGSVCASPESKESISIYSKLFTSIENYLNYLEKLLIWEKPLQSFLLFATLNGVFWLFITSSHRFFFFLSLATILIFLYKTWKSYYSIYYPEKDSGSTLSSHNVAVSQVTYYLLQLWSGICLTAKFLFNLRYRHHVAACSQEGTPTPDGWSIKQKLKFFVLMSSALTALAILGRFVSGTCLTYIIFLCFILWPGIRHKQLFKLPEIRFGVFKYSEDQELEEFLPALNPDSDCDFEMENQPILQDTEILEEPDPDIFEESIEQALVTGLSQFSPFDENTTDSLDAQIMKSDIQFISSHFQDSDSDNEEFAQGLGFNTEKSEQKALFSLKELNDSDLNDFEIVNQDDIDKV